MKDIRFTGYTTLSNCESEPIHVPGTIQPHGVLIAVNNQSFTIDFCSANTLDFLGLEIKAVLGKKLEDIIGDVEFDNVKRHLKENTSDQFYTLTYKSVSFSVSVYLVGDLMMLEVEPFPEKTVTLPDIYQQSRNFISYLEGNKSLRKLCTHVADEIREITGYDRVMIYRFDKEYNGEVYAESLNADIESFLGLKYPHTDIPPQARALFVRNLLRMIPDVNYEPVPMMTMIKNASHQSVDMSSGGLRSVSPIHIEYLKNMGVGASLTVSLIHNQKLWGLIACHHYSPKILPPYTRLSTKLHAHFLTSQISNREAAKEYEASLRINEKLNPILNEINKRSIDYNKDNKQLYECMNADGLAIITEKEIYLSGKTPAKQQITDLVNWLATKTDSDYFVTSRLDGSYPKAIAIKDTASGVFFHSLYKASKQGVLWFRGESEKIISWAGDPEKAIEKSQDSLIPRKSFALWKQVVANTSAVWWKSEIDAGIRLATNIQNNIFLTYITQEEEKYRLQSQQLQKTNEELVNFNFISSHDLQEPLRKIRTFSKLIIEEEFENLSNKGKDYFKRMEQTAVRMQLLLEDLLKYYRTKTAEIKFEKTDLNLIVEDVKKDFEIVIQEKEAAIEAINLCEVNIIQFQLRQLMQNLIGNSLKFSKPGVPPHITIKSKILQGNKLNNEKLSQKISYCHIIITDNGIGFDPEYKSRIFEVFQRLHKDEYEGTGIGLAIVKKIVENHNGVITATSEENKGSRFDIYIPAL